MLAAALLLLMTAPPRAWDHTPAPRPEPAATPAAAAPADAPGPPIVGGYARANRTDPRVHAAYHAALAAITPVKHPGAHLLAAESQVVAGTNFRLQIKLRDGSRWQAVVWHRLDGQYQVTSTTRLD